MFAISGSFAAAGYSAPVGGYSLAQSGQVPSSGTPGPQDTVGIRSWGAQPQNGPLAAGFRMGLLMSMLEAMEDEEEEMCSPECLSRLPCHHHHGRPGTNPCGSPFGSPCGPPGSFPLYAAPWAPQDCGANAACSNNTTQSMALALSITFGEPSQAESPSPFAGAFQSGQPTAAMGGVAIASRPSGSGGPSTAEVHCSKNQTRRRPRAQAAPPPPLPAKPPKATNPVAPKPLKAEPQTPQALSTSGLGSALAQSNSHNGAAVSQAVANSQTGPALALAQSNSHNSAAASQAVANSQTGPALALAQSNSHNGAAVSQAVANSQTGPAMALAQSNSHNGAAVSQAVASEGNLAVAQATSNGGSASAQAFSQGGSSLAIAQSSSGVNAGSQAKLAASA